MEMREAIRADGFAELDLNAMHLITASQLNWSHGDPWDRILAAQAIIEGYTLVSIDKVFDDIALKRIW